MFRALTIRTVRFIGSQPQSPPSYEKVRIAACAFVQRAHKDVRYKVAAANSSKSFFLNASQDQGTLIAAFDSWASLEFGVLKRSSLRELVRIGLSASLEISNFLRENNNKLNVRKTLREMKGKVRFLLVDGSLPMGLLKDQPNGPLLKSLQQRLFEATRMQLRSKQSGLQPHRAYRIIESLRNAQ